MRRGINGNEPTLNKKKKRKFYLRKKKEIINKHLPNALMDDNVVHEDLEESILTHG